MSARARGVRLIILAAFLFSVMSALVKEGGKTLPAPVLVLGRACVTLVASFVWVRAAGLPLWGNDRRRLLMRGVFGSTALLCFFFSVTRLPLGEATILHFLSPVFTAVLASAFLGERIGRRLAVAIGLSLGGAMLVTRPAVLFSDPVALDAAGVAAALVAAAFAAAAYVTVRRLARTDDPLVIVFYFSFVAVLGAIPFVFPLSVWPRGHEWLLLLAIGLVTQLAQVCLTRGLALVPASEGTAIGYVQVVFALAWGTWIFSEPLSTLTLAGGILVLAGTALVVFI